MTTIKCPTHPRYKGKTKPTTECATCNLIYQNNQLKQDNRVLLTQLDDVTEIDQLPIHKFRGNWIKFGLVTDTHLGSLYERLDLLNTAYRIFEDEKVTNVYHCGDVLDGENMYRGQTYEIRHHGSDAQVDHFVENYPKIDKIKTHFVTGNHDLSFWVRNGTDVGRTMSSLRDDMVYLGRDEVDVYLQNSSGFFKLRISHPGGGTAYAISYAPQKYINSLSGGEKPNMIALGHFHKAEYLFYRNVHCFQAGCFQAQTPFMKRRKTPAMMGCWIISVLPQEDGGIRRLKKEFIPFYK